ncbi:uncharacterized protein CLUP02_08747 [Colletotrichum lupini]|uniref:Uncharacterized protein n=1 Tax=Colletotrichum lupini TaxID=145971 RepID=A0A9Q8SU38_9PEZI|nr:uncharacterized protein CLUP02_08747 [Colletotrichum lupini]UQC83253.1 hypothetical protein CLUP02_08747 [Colletotrichum lupini]
MHGSEQPPRDFFFVLPCLPLQVHFNEREVSNSQRAGARTIFSSGSWRLAPACKKLNDEETRESEVEVFVYFLPTWRVLLSDPTSVVRRHPVPPNKIKHLGPNFPPRDKTSVWTKESIREK